MQRVSPEALEQFATEMLVGMDTPRSAAREVAASLVGSDLRGHNSHGVMMFPRYMEYIESGHIAPSETPTVDQEGALVRIDGNDGFGHVAGRRAIEAGAEAAEEHGMATVGIRDASHVGRVGEWAERAAARGLTFTGFVNTQSGSQTVAPPGSADRRLSTNPIAFGFPTFDALPFPVFVDMATSQVANGKIRECEANDVPVPDAWTVTASGGSVDDPVAFFEDGAGALLPLGGRDSGYKGFGLATAAELFGGLVGNGLVAGQRESGYSANAAAFTLVDPLRFASRADVEERVEAFAEHIYSAEFSPDVPMGPAVKAGPGNLPGEPEYRIAMDRLAEGIPIPDRTVEALGDLAGDLGCADAHAEAFEAD